MYLEEIYKSIIFDEEYVKWLDEISEIENQFVNSSSFNSSVALDHGVKHMTRVAQNTYKLMKEYGCDERDCFLGYISGIIYDIGIVNGKKGHAESGSKMVKSFLQKFDFLSLEEIQKIEKAIANHGNGGDNKDVLDIFLAIADKIDLCKERTLGETSIIQSINRYTICIENNTLKICYELYDDNGKEALYIIPKSIDIPKALGSYLNLNVEFYINGVYEDFKDRKSYQGKIYKGTQPE